MKDIVAMREDLASKVKTQRDIIERAERDGRGLDDAEREELKQLDEAIAALQKDIADAEELEARRAKVDADLKALKATGAARKTQPTEPGRVAIDYVQEPWQRYGQLRAFKGPDGERKAYRCGRWLQATFYGNEKARRWCSDNGIETRALSGVTPSAGGVFVPVEFESAVIDNREMYGVFRRYANVMPMSSDTMYIPKHLTHFSPSFVGENTAYSESDPTFGQVMLTAKKAGAITKVPRELADDAIISITDRMATDMAWGFAKLEDDCGFIGTGASAYGHIQGIMPKFLDIDGSGTDSFGIAAAASGHNLPAEIDGTDLSGLMAMLPEYARPGAKWFISSAYKAVIFNRLKIAGGGQTSGTLAGSLFEEEFLGYPVVVAQSLPATLTDMANSLLFFFGDLSLAATLGVRRGIEVMFSDQRYWDSDQIGIKASERFDIIIHDIGTSSAAGPIVAMKATT